MSISVGPTSLDAWQQIQSYSSVIQAVGSVGAILVAVWLSRSDVRRRGRNTATRHAQLLSTVGGLLENACYAIEAALGDYLYKDQSSLRIYLNGIIRDEKFKTVPLSEWPNYLIGSMYWTAEHTISSIIKIANDDNLSKKDGELAYLLLINLATLREITIEFEERSLKWFDENKKFKNKEFIEMIELFKGEIAHRKYIESLPSVIAVFNPEDYDCGRRAPANSFQVTTQE